KLLNNAPGSSVGSLNSLVENSVVSTGCGHLYHLECLQSWFRTQKKKLHNQGITGNFPDHCPTCQVEVHDDQIRRIFLLEDHRDALEKAKFLEKMENLEIYCHQLEVQVHQLQRENDLLLNKVLSPPSTPMGKDDFATIVKNDRVVWLKKDSPPLSGIVLSIFKRDGSLWVKLKLDKKIRTNQRSGLLGSFRFDKKQDWTVPFEEIALEKDFKKNNIIDESSISEPSTPTIMLPPKAMPSFRSSTMSLPGEYMSRYYLGMEGSKPATSYDYINGFGSTMELSENVAEYVRATSNLLGNNADSITSLSTMNTPPTPIKVKNDDINSQEDEQRDYVVIIPSNKAQQTNGKINGEVRTSQDTKTKHVTFADDVEKQPSSLWKSKGNHFRDHDYKNVIEMAMRRDQHQHDLPAPMDESSHDQNLDINLPLPTAEVVSDTSNNIGDGRPPLTSEETFQVPTLNLIGPSTSSTPCSTPTMHEADVQADIFIDTFEHSSQNIDSQGNISNFNHSCFNTTFTVLFYGCDVFDKAVLYNESTNDQIQQSVQHILKNEFVIPFRESQKFEEGYSSRLHTAISHLCSSYLDLEELLTILFEYIFKMPPFISYSYDMCDYIHQFFIDFTDKARKPTVQQLFERSLSLQDNLKLRGDPSPALLLQMPNSEDGIIHYDAVVPSLSLDISQLLEKGLDGVKTESLACYCNKTASLECATCSKIHGKSPVLFCEDCSVLLEAIHDQMYHKLELVPIKAMDIPTTTLDLAAVICLKGDNYSAFMRNVTENDDKPKWVFINEFEGGEAKMEHLPELEGWIEAISSDTSKVDTDSLTPLHRRLLTDCRMFLYLPAQNNSFA
ncbi:Ubiquitin carboxyl-terminal hydrolase CYLD, partial [Orchesella cincta]